MDLQGLVVLVQQEEEASHSKHRASSIPRSHHAHQKHQLMSSVLRLEKEKPAPSSGETEVTGFGVGTPAPLILGRGFEYLLPSLENEITIPAF